MGQNAMFLLKRLTIYTETSIINNGFLLLENGRIAKIGRMEECPVNTNGYTVIDFQEKAVAIPGLIDLHIHGASGADTMDASREALQTMTHSLPSEGTTSFLATTITQSNTKLKAAIDNVATYMDRDNEPGNAEILGIHLEGPFISPSHIGAQPKEFVVSADVHLFNELQALAKGNIKVLTLAPEIDNGLALVKAASDMGVIVSIGHSNATFNEVSEAVGYGASQITHLYNQMRPMHHREPGVVGAAMLLEQLMVEMIPDGVHVHPKIMKIAYDVIGKERMMIITDSMRAKGLANGNYDLGGQCVRVDGNKATLDNGTLAGSTLRMIDGFKNMIEFTGCSIDDAIRLGSTNPAVQLKVFDRKGSIKEGKDADIVILDTHYQIQMTFCRGQIAYIRGKEDSV
jgi:N-acetylglucosamine-6-phosphate deacetylase